MPPSTASASSSIKSLSIAFSPPSAASPSGISRALPPTTDTVSLAFGNGTTRKNGKGKEKEVEGDVIPSTEGLGRVGQRKKEVENDDEDQSTEESSSQQPGDTSDHEEVQKDGDTSTGEFSDSGGEVTEEPDGGEERDPSSSLERPTAAPDGDNEGEGSDQASESSLDSEDEEEDDEEEEEPTLKYARLGGSTGGILEKDTASALLVSDKYIVSSFRSSFRLEV